MKSLSAQHHKAIELLATGANNKTVAGKLEITQETMQI